METPDYYWTITYDSDDTHKYIAERYIFLSINKPVRVTYRFVPFWFVQFANWNTEGVTAACELYLGSQGENVLIDPT